jgi:hypothetical protein
MTAINPTIAPAEVAKPTVAQRAKEITLTTLKVMGVALATFLFYAATITTIAALLVAPQFLGPMGVPMVIVEFFIGSLLVSKVKEVAVKILNPCVIFSNIYNNKPITTWFSEPKAPEAPAAPAAKVEVIVRASPRHRIYKRKKINPTAS